MSDTNLLEELKNLLSRKKGKMFYAEKLGISVSEVEDLMYELRKNPVDNVETPYFATSTNSYRHNLESNVIEVSKYYDAPPTPEQVVADHKIDTEKWKLSNYWSKGKGNGWLVSALFSQKSIEKEILPEQFEKFLQTYKPQSKVIAKQKKEFYYSNTCLIFNTQYAHYNKYCTSGENDINKRFEVVYSKAEKILKKSSLSSNLQEVIYILGSDIINSEFTNQTTHGTPQQNIGTYEEGFEAICNHEITMIDLLLSYSDNVKVLYIPGNHGRHAEWHMLSWLKVYYRNNPNVTIDTSISFTKYMKYSNTALMFNHGYKVKPEQLAQKFPIEFKSEWGSCDNYYIFVGDLHTELSKDIGGIKFFRLPQVSKATSSWDEENGYTLSRGQLTAFLIEENNGVTDTYREIL